MKKIIYPLFVLFLVLIIGLSSCTLPAKVDETTLPEDLEPTPAQPYALPEEAPTAIVALPGVNQEAPQVQTATAQPEPSEVTATTAAAEPAAQPAEPASQSPTATPDSPTPAPQPVGPAANATRIQFQTGTSSGSVRGELNGGETAYYVLTANAGQTMTVDVWSPNGDVFLSAAGVSDNKVLLEATNRSTKWSGTLPANQDYLLAVTAGGGRTSFSVDVVIPPGTAQATSVPGTAQPTATQSSSSATRFDPNATWGKPKFTDAMDATSKPNWVNKDGVWPDSSNISVSLENNRVYVTGKRLGFSTWWFSWPSITNFYLEMTAETGTCSGKDAYGMILRGPEHGAQKSYGYIVSYSCDGAYSVTRVDGADPYRAVTLVDWTKSEHIVTGSNQQNVMGIQANGKTITVYANGYKLTEVTDDTYKTGRYGVFVAPANTSNFTYRPVKIAYWLLD